MRKNIRKVYDKNPACGDVMTLFIELNSPATLAATFLIYDASAYGMLSLRNKKDDSKELAFLFHFNSCSHVAHT